MVMKLFNLQIAPSMGDSLYATDIAFISCETNQPAHPCRLINNVPVFIILFLTKKKMLVVMIQTRLQGFAS
jgi:hypothetical protein